jgi:hypothetical protein
MTQIDLASYLLSNILEKLAISRTQLAAMLMVTDRTLYDWADRQVSELPPKGRRLARLWQIINELESVIPEFGLSQDHITAILNDGRIPVESDDDESDSMSLVSYITAHPDDHGWKANVHVAVQDYRDYLNLKSGSKKRASVS